MLPGSLLSRPLMDVCVRAKDRKAAMPETDLKKKKKHNQKTPPKNLCSQSCCYYTNNYPTGKKVHEVAVTAFNLYVFWATTRK